MFFGTVLGLRRLRNLLGGELFHFQSVDCDLLAHFGHFVNLHMGAKSYDEDVALDELDRQDGLGEAIFCAKGGCHARFLGLHS